MNDSNINMQLHDDRLNRTDERKIFEVELVGKNEPMCLDNFYVWLNNKPRRENYKIGAIKEYLASLGFDMRNHKVSPKTLKILGYVFSYYWDTWSSAKEPMPMSDLLLSVRDGFNASTFYINFTPFKRVQSNSVIGTSKLWDILRHPDFCNTWRIVPDIYYFHVTHDGLWLKGQSVISSTFICQLTSGSVDKFVTTGPA